MSENNHSNYDAISALVSNSIALSEKEAAIIDLDRMCACVLNVCSTDNHSITHTYESEGLDDFYEGVARAIFNDAIDSSDVMKLCVKFKKAFERYIRSDKYDNEPLTLGDNSQIATSTKEIFDIYERSYNTALKKLLADVASNISSTTPIILIGQLSAFYPAEHTVKEVLYPMPFSPTPRIITHEDFKANSKSLIAKGMEILEKNSLKNKRFSNTLSLVLKKATSEGLIDVPFTLADKDSLFSNLENPTFTPATVIYAAEPLTLLFGNTTHSVVLPNAIFSKGVIITLAKIGLGLLNGKPALLINVSEKVTTVELDSKIYLEEQ